MENLRKRVDITIATSKKKFLQLSAKPSFKQCRIINENVVLVQRLKRTLYLNRPLYVGLAILDLSKTFLYQFHYNFIKPMFKSKAELLFTDTDSLCYQIYTDDIYKTIREHSERFDTSNFPPSHPTYSTQNKKVLGMMKDEMGGVPIVEFVGLRPKLYSIKTSVGEEKCVGKGVTRATLKRKIRHTTYRDCLLKGERTIEDMESIQSFNHKIYSIKKRKVALSPADDKRYVCSNGIFTYAYGHTMCGIEECEEL